MGQVKALEYNVIRSLRKTVSLEVERNGTVLVRAPLLMPPGEIDRFVASHEQWIVKKQVQQSARAYRESQADSRAEELIRQAKQKIPPLVRAYSEKMEVTFTTLKITSAKTRFGSCSSKGALCFSWRLMMYPAAAIEYVVVHELAHLKHHNHSRAFYATVEQYMPDYKRREQFLRDIP